MKSLLIALTLTFVLGGSAFADCGMCGAGEGAKPDKAATLLQASQELEKTNPELAAKLKDMAGEVSEHKH